MEESGRARQNIIKVVTVYRRRRGRRRRGERKKKKNKKGKEDFNANKQ